eukprot:6179539-Pleurochrysis_carterae.AAC.2
MGAVRNKFASNKNYASTAGRSCWVSAACTRHGRGSHAHAMSLLECCIVYEIHAQTTSSSQCSGTFRTRRRTLVPLYTHQAFSQLAACNLRGQTVRGQLFTTRISKLGKRSY